MCQSIAGLEVFSFGFGKRYVKQRSARISIYAGTGANHLRHALHSRFFHYILSFSRVTFNPPLHLTLTTLLAIISLAKLRFFLGIELKAL